MNIDCTTKSGVVSSALGMANPLGGKQKVGSTSSGHQIIEVDGVLPYLEDSWTLIVLFEFYNSLLGGLHPNRKGNIALGTRSTNILGHNLQHVRDSRRVSLEALTSCVGRL